MPSCIDLSNVGAGMSPLTKLHGQFATTRESVRDASTWLLDADETTHADDLVCFLFSSFSCHSRCGVGCMVSRWWVRASRLRTYSPSHQPPSFGVAEVTAGSKLTYLHIERMLYKPMFVLGFSMRLLYLGSKSFDH
jgi:hypothetical protein